MKLTRENIDQINDVLIKDIIHYIDLRIEIIDHLSSELEEIEGDFDTVFPEFYMEKKAFVKEMFISHMKADYKKGYKRLLKKIFSWQFLLLFLAVNFFIFVVFQYNDKVWLLDNFDIMPIVLPLPITAIMLYNFLFSKNKSTDLTSLLGVTNLLIMTYVFGGIYIVRKSEILVWLPMFSFYISINIAYYFFYFSSKKKHKQKYNSLSFKR